MTDPTLITMRLVWSAFQEHFRNGESWDEEQQAMEAVNDWLTKNDPEHMKHLKQEGEIEL